MEAVISASDWDMGSVDARQTYLDLEREFMDTGFNDVNASVCRKSILGREEG